MAAPLCIITGAAGFIGSHLSRRLLADTDLRIVGLDNFDPMYARSLKEANLATLKSPAFQLIELDLCNRDALIDVFTRHRPDVVVHLAALAGVRPSIAEPERYTAVNVVGTVNVLDAMKACDCPRLVFASSSSVYGNSSKPPFREDDHADQPISPYAATKRAGELLCHTYAHLFGFRIAALRFFTVYGPAQRPDLAIMRFMKLIASGRPIQMFGNGSTRRDYTYIDDIVEGVVASMRLVRTGEEPLYRAFNLGGSRAISLDEMIRAIEKTVGRSAQIVHTDQQPGDVELTSADLTRSSAELGYRPQTSFDEGLKRQWEWLKERLHAPEHQLLGSR